MNIQLNGKHVPVADGMTIGELIRQKDLDPAAVVVEHNMAIVKATELDRTALKENDTLEILRFVGGG